jgi:hypothetical protein
VGTSFTRKNAFLMVTLSSTWSVAEEADMPQRGLGWLHEVKRPPLMR